MAFGDIIDSFAEGGLSSSGIVFGTDVTTPVTGNLMLMVFGDRNNGTSTPSGWTELYTVDPWSGSSSTRMCIYAKVAAASESDITFSVTNGRPAFAYYEVEGSFEALTGGPDILEHSGHSEATITIANGEAPGTSGTLSQADCFALTATAYRGGSGSTDHPASSSVDSGFTTGEYIGYAGSNTYGVVTAYKVTNATTALNPLLSWTIGGSSNDFLGVSMMVILKKEAAGGGGVTPIPTLIQGAKPYAVIAAHGLGGLKQ